VASDGKHLRLLSRPVFPRSSHGRGRALSAFERRRFDARCSALTREFDELVVASAQAGIRPSAGLCIEFQAFVLQKLAGMQLAIERLADARTR
jgi:hypothetical protein